MGWRDGRGYLCRLRDLSREGVGDSDRLLRRTAWGGGFAGWAFFCVVRRGGVGGKGCRSFDVRVVCDEFAVGVDSFLHGQMWRGIGEHWVGIGLANLERLEKILLGCLARDRHWGMCWRLHGAARRVDLSEDDAHWAGRELG